MPGRGKRIGLTVQEDRIRGGTAQRDKRDGGGDGGSRLETGHVPWDVNPFISDCWRTVLRIKNNRNIRISFRGEFGLEALSDVNRHEGNFMNPGWRNCGMGLR